MKLYEVKVAHDNERRSYYDCAHETYHIAAENDIEAKIKAVERFRLEQKLKVTCAERDVDVVESTIMPSAVAGAPWWRRLG